jgi:C1A family cysteine protease
MMRAIVLVCLAVSAAAAHSKPREYYEELFFEHIQQFKLKIVDGKDFLHRIANFASNIDLIENHNADVNQTYKMGVNQFTHLSFDEFKAAVNLGTRRPNLRKGDSVYTATGRVDVTDSKDWTAEGAVTPVKDQGQCGSCWSFSATGSMESAHYIKHRGEAGATLLSLSEQQLVSCAPSPNEGCNGGWMDDAFDYVTANGGLPTEAAYPYVSGTTQKDETCKAQTPVAGTAPTGHVTVDQKADALKEAVFLRPVSIAIQANQMAFQVYKSGVLTGKCGTELDHGVLAVGYGTDAATGVDYWKVKNSWGPSWGEQGYIRIERSDENKCGVLSAASYPTY